MLGWAWGVPAVTGDTIYVGTAGARKYVTRHERGIIAMDRASGRIKWRTPVPKTPDTFVSGYPGSVVLPGDVLIAGSVSGTIDGYRLR